MKRINFCLMGCLMAVVFSSCIEKEKVTPLTDMPLIILDTDLGSSTDDLFSLQHLYLYHRQGACKLLGIVVDRMGENNAAIADLMNTYYGCPDIPIGLERTGIPDPKVWIDYSALPSYTTPSGEPLFHRTLERYDTLPDGWRLYRRLLAAQPDHSVSIVSIGFVTALAQLLESEGDEYSPLSGVELVRQKVKCAYVMGGIFGDAIEPDYNFSQAIEFSLKFFQLWPNDVDIVLSPGEIGDAVEYTPDQVIADISWTDRHPIKQVYMRCDCNTGQKMWDLMAVYQTMLGDELFTLSERGTVELTPDGKTHFTPDPDGNYRYQLTWGNAMLQRIRRVTLTH